MQERNTGWPLSVTLSIGLQLLDKSDASLWPHAYSFNNRMNTRTTTRELRATEIIPVSRPNLGDWRPDQPLRSVSFLPVFQPESLARPTGAWVSKTTYVSHMAVWCGFMFLGILLNDCTSVHESRIYTIYRCHHWLRLSQYTAIGYKGCLKFWCLWTWSSCQSESSETRHISSCLWPQQVRELLEASDLTMAEPQKMPGRLESKEYSSYLTVTTSGNIDSRAIDTIARII